ncbi:hypothetical protein EVG20_g3402 [Dentipellis fragilis]|uniref:Sas10 C-terminal domain-containing protein n=1 Tax=Dentipellis fragilis TaxID=205917 RepID=A0A4Y9Z419_9AGAM|nr:hypothetical protein EVG20_g3402 [Dentipellis fragilis]
MSTPKPQADDTFELYDLRVEVVCPPGERMLCGAKPGDHFTLEGEMLRLPPGQGFSIYSLKLNVTLCYRCGVALARGKAASNGAERLDDDGCGGRMSRPELQVEIEDSENRSEEVQSRRDYGGSATREEQRAVTSYSIGSGEIWMEPTNVMRIGYSERTKKIIQSTMTNIFLTSRASPHQYQQTTMVRRRVPKKGTKAGPRSVDRKDSKMKRWNRAEDIPMDEEDQFHASRDKILLDGGEFQSDDEGDEDEVFALKGIHASDDDDEEEGDEDMEGLEDDEDEEASAPAPAKKSKSKSKAKAQPEISDEENEESEEEESWGRSKAAYYSSNAAELESDDEELNELEEQEAKRLQSKGREVMAEDDFGLGDVVEVEEGPIVDLIDIEPPPKVETQPMLQDRKAIIRHLQKTSPETLALANDWEDVAQKLVRSQERIKELEANEPDNVALGMIHLHYRTFHPHNLGHRIYLRVPNNAEALLTYATTLAFYLHLRASDKYAHRPELLRTHPIFPRLLQLKQALSTLEDLDFDLSASSDVDEDEDEDEYEDLDDLDDEMSFLANDAAALDARSFKLNKKLRKMDFEDLAALLRDAEEEPVAPYPASFNVNINGKSKSQSIKKISIQNPRTTKEEAQDGRREAPADVRPYRARLRMDMDTDAYGEASALGAVDAADKSARKRTLRFHTARIEGASARRQGAREAMGGDDDVPYRERQKQKEERLRREAAKKGLGAGGEDLDADVEVGKKRAREEEESAGSGSGEEDEDGYYSLVKKQKKERKEAKKADYEAMQELARPDVDDDTAEGPRLLTRAILKNRGLTPHRSKSVRNPRVKKRQRFEKAKKVIASQKAVYKGAVDATRYGGEQTGISKVVKSVRF